MIELTPD